MNIKLYIKACRASFLLLSLLLISLFCQSCYFLPTEEEVLAPPLIVPPSVTYDTIILKRGDIIKDLNIPGSLIPRLQTDLYFNQRGRLHKVNIAVSSEVKKGDLLVELDTGDLEYQLEQRKLALKKAEISYEIAKLQFESGNAIDEYNLQLAEVDIQSIKLELEHLNQSLQEAKLYSPVDGIVTYVGDISPGDFVDAYYKFISISEPGDLLVEYKGDKAGDFSLGDQVKLRIDSEQYDGEVAMVPSSVPFEEFEKYKNTLRIKVINLNEEIKMGTIVTINLVLDESKDTLILPRNVVKTYDGKKYVYVLEDGVRVEKYIDTGIETNSYVEVTSGLKEGEEIISN